VAEHDVRLLNGGLQARDHVRALARGGDSDGHIVGLRNRLEPKREDLVEAEVVPPAVLGVASTAIVTKEQNFISAAVPQDPHLQHPLKRLCQVSSHSRRYCRMLVDLGAKEGTPAKSHCRAAANAIIF
jgi:hypothetical protein